MWIDFLRLLAISQVIMIHVSAPLFYKDSLNSYEWWVASCYDTFCRGGVPIFIMVSGALLLGSKESYPQFFKRFFNRIIIPFIAWSFLYIFLKAYQQHQAFNLILAIKQIIEGQQIYHLLFMYIIIGLYLVLPIMRTYATAANLTNQVYFLSVWFVVVAVLPLITKFFSIGFAFNFTVVTGFIGYFLGGYTISKMSLPKNTSRAVIFYTLIIVVMVLFGEWGTYALSLKEHNPDELFYEYLSPNIILMSFSIFLLIRTLEVWFGGLSRKYKIFNWVLLKFRSITYGVYYVHVLILIVLAHLGITALGFNPIFSIPLLTLGILVFSSLVIIGLKKIPLLKRLC